MKPQHKVDKKYDMTFLPQHIEQLLTVQTIDMCNMSHKEKGKTKQTKIIQEKKLPFQVKLQILTGANRKFEIKVSFAETKAGCI